MITAEVCKRLYMNTDVDLKPFCNKAIFCSNFIIDRITLYVIGENYKRTAIQFKIPTYNKQIPDRLVPRYESFFNTEYEIIKGGSSEEIDWDYFAIKMNENINKLYNEAYDTKRA